MSGPSDTNYCVSSTDDCTPNLNYTGTITLTNEGHNYVRFRTRDIAGNLQDINSSGLIKIDKIKPRVIWARVDSYPNPAKSGARTITIRFDEPMDQGIAPTVTVTGLIIDPYTVVGSWSDTNTWSGTFNLINAEDSGIATIVIRDANDVPGHQMDINSEATFEVDTVASVIKSISVNKPEYRVTQDANVIFTIIDDGTSETITINGNNAIKGDNNTWTYVLTHGKTTTGTHSAQIIATDVAGNTAQYFGYYRIVEDVDLTLPTITFVNSTTGQTTSTITFNSSKDGQAKIYYGIDTNYGMTTTYYDVNANQDKTISLSGLKCGTTYNYKIYAKDDSENESITNNLTITTEECTIYQFEFPKSGNGFGTGRSQGIISKIELEAVDVLGTSFKMSDLLNANGGITAQKTTTSDFNNVYMYNSTDGWVTIPNTDYATYDLYNNMRSINYFVFELNSSATGKSIRFESLPI
jgi:hypothetical protein